MIKKNKRGNWEIIRIKAKITLHNRRGGRVEPGGCPPGALADPDVPNFRTAGPRHPVPLVKVSLSNMSALSGVSGADNCSGTPEMISSSDPLSGFSG
jgi:hypothetical protein